MILGVFKVTAFERFAKWIVNYYEACKRKR